jgi:hypothetical protein
MYQLAPLRTARLVAAAYNVDGSGSGVLEERRDAAPDASAPLTASCRARAWPPPPDNAWTSAAASNEVVIITSTATFNFIDSSVGEEARAPPSQSCEMAPDRSSSQWSCHVGMSANIGEVQRYSRVPGSTGL